jgi:LacI family transcriptional regulator
MAERPTIRDVAKAANTSVGSISNYLNNTKRVSENTRERIDRAIDELGFIPNSAVRVVLGGRSHAIGFIIPDAGNPFLTEVARGIEDVAIDARNVVIICNTASDPNREAHYARALSEMRVVGAIVMALSTTEAHMRTLEASGAAVVVLGASAQGSRFPTVGTDNEQGGFLATQHLLERGHRDIAFIGGPGADQAIQDRLAGSRRAFAEAGVDPEKIRRVDAHGGTLSSRMAAAEEVLSLQPRPTAAVCANDLIALALETVLLREDVSVPEEFALVGYDDIEAAETAPVPLTTVRQPKYELGRAAAELVLELAAGVTPQHHNVFPAELIIRSST